MCVFKIGVIPTRTLSTKTVDGGSVLKVTMHGSLDAADGSPESSSQLPLVDVSRSTTRCMAARNASGLFGLTLGLARGGAAATGRVRTTFFSVDGAPSAP